MHSIEALMLQKRDQKRSCLERHRPLPGRGAPREAKAPSMKPPIGETMNLIKFDVSQVYFNVP